MKIDPINLILNKEFKYNANVYFISGNEITLMNKVKDLIIKNLDKNDSLDVQTVKNLKSINRDVGLFNKRRLYIVVELDEVEENLIDSFDDDVFLFYCENSPKVNSVKRKFLKNKKSFVIDCYELNKDTKIKIINNFLLYNNLEIEKKLFWNFVDMLDNKYMLLEKELEKIKEIHPENINYDTLIKTISKIDLVDDKIFFKLMSANEDIINTYNSKITNQTEASKFYFTIKKFTSLIIDNEEEKDFEKNIPKYLFREKKTLVSIYQRFSFKKKKNLINLLFKTDIAMRKNASLSVVIGLRFLLNLKKIIIS
tara:strand:+ start:2278 stop:3210 length:933 start_codon:yes stop_codon:yes gene_type:complete